MRIERKPSSGLRPAGRSSIVVAMLGACLGVNPVADAAGADHSAERLSAGDRVCVGCHAADGLTRKLANGDSLSLTVDGAAFAGSVHGPMGCIGCHPQVALPAHPGDVPNIDDARQYAMARSESCRACHGRVFRPYEGSVHALRLRAGSAAGPACGDCHPPHAVTPRSTQEGPTNACVRCHGDTAAQHERWLPNAARHLRAVACSACHAPDALRRVDLRVLAGGERLTDRDGSVPFEQHARAADTNHDGLDANEFRRLLTSLEREGNPVALQGYIELRSGIEAHELPPKAAAIKDCVKCHDEKALPFQNVTVSGVDADGRPIRYDVHREVLSSPITWDALRGFYAIGGTRMKLLDVLLALGLVGGITVPALHLALRRLSRRAPNPDGSTR
ncbi:MAG: hypothetical protein IPQ15_07500 [Betaproteobacteria bacterium]|nr:hypothetical protein [Betaproteobacteria bacterium]